jgi:glyoxylase-like metal-dependent hydrolase (beta-lactamase superfamily II)
VIELQGSKTPGELCVILEEDTLVAGDLLRGHRAGRLNLLPDAKLADKAQAIASLERLVALERLDAVLVGDGWPVFRAGAAALRELLREVRG